MNLRPDYTQGRPRAAVGTFPYDHPTLAQVDAEIARRKAACEKSQATRRRKKHD